MTLTQAITTNDPATWLHFRHSRNILFKELEMAKTLFMSDGFATNKQKWKNIGFVVKDKVSSTPKQIIHDGKLITSAVEIANVANLHYRNKINNIRTQFQHESRDPIQILEGLIPRGSKELNFYAYHPGRDQATP